MKFTETKNRKGSEMTIVNKNGIDYLVEEVGNHSVKCTNQAMCLLPGTFKYVPATAQDGSATTRRIKIHKVPAHTRYTPIKN